MKRDILQTVSQDLGVKKDLVLLEAIQRHTGDNTVELDKLLGRLHRTYFTGDKIECWYLDDNPIVEFYRLEYITDDFKFKVEQRYRSIAPPIPRPRCYNCPECAPGYWGMHGRPAPGAKPRYRWVQSCPNHLCRTLQEKPSECSSDQGRHHRQ